jgi:hypothetical protein
LNVKKKIKKEKQAKNRTPPGFEPATSELKKTHDPTSNINAMCLKAGDRSMRRGKKVVNWRKHGNIGKCRTRQMDQRLGGNQNSFSTPSAHWPTQLLHLVTQVL